LEFDEAGRPPAHFLLKEGERVKLGRNPKLDVPFNVLRISWLHCEFLVLRNDDGFPVLGIKDLSSNGTGLQPEGRTMRKMSKDEERPLEDGTRVVLPVKLQAKKGDATEGLRESFVVRLGNFADAPAEAAAAANSLVGDDNTASAGAVAAASLLAQNLQDEEASSDANAELAEQEAAAAAQAAAAKQAEEARKKQMEEAQRVAAAEKALREKKAAEAAESAKRTAEQAAEIQKAAYEKAMQEFRQKRKQPGRGGDQAEVDEVEEDVNSRFPGAADDEVAEESVKRARRTAPAGHSRLLPPETAAKLPAMALPEFERAQELVLKGSAEESTGKAEEAFENYRIGLAILLKQVLPHLGQTPQAAAELKKQLLDFLERAEKLKAKWGGRLPPAKRYA